VLRRDRSLAAFPVLGVFVAVAVVVALATAAIGTALTTIFRVALLRFATTGEHPSGFAQSDLQVAFRPRRRGVGQPAG
jgi:hypothetical protein